MTIDANTGEFCWTPTEAQGGTAPSVTITVTDSGTGNLIDSETFTITVNDTNTAPVLAAIGNQTVDELATLTFTATATDTDLPADTLTFSLDAASLAAGHDHRCQHRRVQLDTDRSSGWNNTVGHHYRDRFRYRQPD